MKKRIISIFIIFALALTGCAAQGSVEETPAEQPAETPEQAEEIASESSFTWETGEEDTAEHPVLKLDYEGGGREYAFTTETLDGEAVDSAELFARAKVTMLNIWGTYCYPCLMEMPDLGQLARDYAGEDFQLIGIIVDANDAGSDTVETAAGQIAETGADYPHLLATDDVIKNVMFDVYAVPTTLFLDSEGKLICSAVVGSKAYETWAGAVDELLAR